APGQVATLLLFSREPRVVLGQCALVVLAINPVATVLGCADIAGSDAVEVRVGIALIGGAVTGSDIPDHPHAPIVVPSHAGRIERRGVATTCAVGDVVDQVSHVRVLVRGGTHAQEIPSCLE